MNTTPSDIDPSKTPGTGAGVLVIDDSLSIRKLIDKILSMHGFTVYLAASAHEGIEMARKHHPDIIVCDVNMPVYDGFFVLATLRKEAQFELTPFVFVSGEAVERQDVRRGMVQGADDYLFKPFSPTELVEAIEVRLKKHALYVQKHRQKTSPFPDFLHPYERLEADILTALNESRSMSLFSVDIDRFKRINDALGFENADKLLHLLLERFEPLAQNQRNIYSGAHAGQIVLVSDPLVEPEAVDSIARELLSLISDPLDFQSYQLHLTCSVGVHHVTAEKTSREALEKAYVAMNQAKKEGGNMYKVYQADMHTLLTRQLTWEKELHQALQNNWFLLHYQPQVDLISGEVTGVEALIRLQHPELGLIYPGEFIQIAEDTGLICAIGDWCLDEACRQLKHWHNMGYSSLRMAVNVSVLQFQQGNLTEKVLRTLKKHDLKGEFLEIELTESSLVRDLDAIQSDLQRLRDAAITLAIDDFGTGYSSLSYLRHLPFDLLKIDQSFIRGMTDSSASLAIPKAIIDMGHSMGLEILSEGIENQQQMLLLKSYGCDLGQGYFLSKPLGSEALEDYLREKPVAAHQ